MAAIKSTDPSYDRRLRVLLVGNSGVASSTLASWLGERGALDVTGPAESAAEALALAVQFKPHVVLLDFHWLPASQGSTVATFKALTPTPLVLVLTHDSSEAMRRRCRDAQADGIFDKTTELEAMVSILRDTQISLA